MNKKSKITKDEFDYSLRTILSGMSLYKILEIPGVYDAVSKELKKNVIKIAQNEKRESWNL